MPNPVPRGLRLGTAEPADAVAAFEARRKQAFTFNWHDVWEAEHASRFMVAGVAQADVLQLFQDALQAPLEQGQSLADYSRALKPQLQAKGWWGGVEITDKVSGEIRTTQFNDARLQLIYDVNLRQSYAAGRWAAIERGKERQPLVMYRTMRDERVRASHAAWDGLALPVDDPFWQQHYPPNGWRCRCTAFALSEKDLQRRQARGDRIQTTAPPEEMVPYRDPRTGATAKAPLGVDPGFAYNPGQHQVRQAAALLRDTLDGAAPELAKAQVQQLVRSNNFKRFVNKPVAGEELPVAMLPADQAQALQAQTRVVMLSGETLGKQARNHPDVTPEDYAWAQLAVDAGERIQDGPRAAVYLLEQDGWVAVVKATRTGQGLYLSSFRRISSNEVRRDEEILRLRAKAGRPDA